MSRLVLQVGYLNDWLEQMSRTIEGLSFHQDYLLEHWLAVYALV